MTDSPSESDTPEARRPYLQEAVLLKTLPTIKDGRILCTSPGLAQFAAGAAFALPESEVICTYLDLYRATLAREHCSSGPANLRIECAADLPLGEADVVALPFSASGEAELTRELIQQGHERLRIGGKMLASSDRPGDAWLGEQMRKVFAKVERRESEGVLYIATKVSPLKKAKDFACEFAFRDRGRLIRAFSRPGVFSHRKIDSGARQLIEEMEIRPGNRILDIGCGSGVVALAAACRAEGVSVRAIDSNARAVECARRGAELNQLENVTTELNADGRFSGAGGYDVALANPPYYAGFRIAEHFLTAGQAALRPGGRIFVVTKQPGWYAERMPGLFEGVSAVERKGYHVFQGRRPEE
jgi:16S rRNA (guanine1207-N2)-methyltransferase